MIVVKIQGGLGNQMFQYAHGRFLSEKFNLDLKLDTSFYDNYDSKSTLREFQLNSFENIKSNISIIDDIDFSNFYKIGEHFSYIKIPYIENCKYYLDGYWQSEKFFIELSELIRKDFEPSKSILNKILENPLSDTTISLHVRRGDYLTSNGFHPVQSINYYQKAIETIGEYDNIFVFSDDIKWCKENLKFKNMIFIEGLSDLEDLHLMSMCKHNIIANSSFSWWGAWLNKNPNKIVVSPTIWFNGLNSSDIIPENWIRI